jgi:hypothetical protein
MSHTWDTYGGFSDLTGFEFHTAVTMKNNVFWVIIQLVRRQPDVSEEVIASIFRVEK